MSIFLIENLNFWGHLSTFGAENTPKSRPFKVKNKAQTLPKQVQNNFEKVDKSTFWPPKWPKHGCQLGQKWRIFGIRSLSYIQFPTVQIPTTTFLQTDFPTHSVSYRRAFLHTEFPKRCVSYRRVFLQIEFSTLTVTYKINFRQP